MLTFNKPNRSLGKLVITGAAFSALISAAAPSYAQTFNNTIFGPNVYVFDPSATGAQINTQLDKITFTDPAADQFRTDRSAVLFKPGTYKGVNHEIGFYTSVSGLGVTPDSVILNGGGLYTDRADGSNNVTTNFWRSMENLQIPAPVGGQETWAVSQGAPLRRVHVTNSKLALDNCHYASGGFISDTAVDSTLQACSQQQYYTRNSNIGNFTGTVWNYVFSGVVGAPPQSFTAPAGNTPYTTLQTTPVSREKPYLYVDGSGNYNVFVPSLLTNSRGTDWVNNGGLGTGSSQPIGNFFIASPSTGAAQINSALASGKNLILTPGIYALTAAINVTRANTVVLGLGFPTLVPQGGNSAITVADVDGVQIAGMIVDAGSQNSAVLFQVGTAGSTSASRANHAANPTSIEDVFFRIGGATSGSATTSLQIDSNNVLLDDIWAWRADHGNGGIGWTVNTAAHGVIVNGDNVTALGLAVEHYQQSQVVWNGNGGETIFYQSEDPYDPPSQAAWTDGSQNGYPSYEVASSVCNHTAYGLGIYSFFNQGVNIIQDNAISAPNTSGINFHDMVTVKLTGSGNINSIINGIGGPANQTSGPNDLLTYSGTGACPTPTQGNAVDINVAGPAVTPYVADQGSSVAGGTANTNHAIIIPSSLVNPAPALVYQSNRAGQVTYTVSGFAKGSTHTVRLHFCEIYFSAPNQRVFDITINNVLVKTDYDIIANAKAEYTADIQQFTTTANPQGQVVISLTNGTQHINQPEISGIEVQ